MSRRLGANGGEMTAYHVSACSKAALLSTVCGCFVTGLAIETLGQMSQACAKRLSQRRLQEMRRACGISEAQRRPELSSPTWAATVALGECGLAV